MIWLVIALVPWVFVASGRRVRSILLIVVDTVAVGFLVLPLDDAAAMFIAIVAICWAAAQGLQLASIIGFIGGAAIVSLAMAMEHDAFKRSGSVSWITGLATGWFMGVLVNRQRQLTDDLNEARHELSLAAIRDERAMVAREVHDIVGHGLTVALLNISGARRHLSKNPETAAEALDRAETVTRDSLETVRNVVGLLSSEHQRFEPMPGGADVCTIVEQARQSGLPVTLALTGDPAELEPAIGLTLVRLLQESLSNASRHAPGAAIDVSLTVATNNVIVVVSNLVPHAAERAPSTNRHGLGLASMTDRVAAVRGTLDIGRCDDRWLVHCVLPRTIHAGPEIVAT
jgi:signal transduction histidine kinase